MSLLFADIYDGIRCLRIQKGACERDILNYIQEKVGGCMKVGNVLKTIKTLKKLVDDGVLEKKGNRYIFTGKNPDEGEEEEEEEEEEEDDCNKESELDMDDDECDIGDDDDDEDEGDDDDDDDDGDDDEEDDDDDDDDDECDDKEGGGDEECDDKNVNPAQGGNGDEKKCEEQDSSSKSKSSFPGNPKPSCSPPQNGNGATAPIPDKASNKDPCLQKSTMNRNLTTEKKTGKVAKDATVIDQDTNKGDEAIAFCARDFIDSVRQQGNAEERNQTSGSSVANMAANMKENMGTETIINNSIMFSSKRKARAKKNFESRSLFRSRSPIKKVKANLFTTLKQDSDEIGFREISSEIFREPVDVEMEVDPEKQETGFEKPSPVGTPILPLPDGGRLDRQESCCSNLGTDAGDIKLEPCLEEPMNPSTGKSSRVKLSVLKNGDCGMTWYPLEESEKQQEILKQQAMLKRSLSPEKSRTAVGRHVSLCSVCEKKKRNS